MGCVWGGGRVCGIGKDEDVGEEDEEERGRMKKGKDGE